MKRANPIFYNGAYTEHDAARDAMKFDDLARLYRELKEYGGATSNDAPLPTVIHLGSPERDDGLDLDLAEYELSDNPFVPDGHYVLLRRRRDPLVMLMPTALPDIVIFSPHKSGGYRVLCITNPRPLADAFRYPTDDRENDFYDRWRSRLLGR